MYASLGRTERARQDDTQMQREARRLGRDDIAAHIRLRSAWLHQLEGDEVFARAALKEIAADRTPAARMARATALVLLARLDRKRGEPVAADALAGELRGLGGNQPVLLFSPPVEKPTNAAADRPTNIAKAMTDSALRRMPMQRFEKQWIDVGFRVGPEGRVGDVEMLRSQGSTDWAKPVLQAIAGRIYSPVGASAGPLSGRALQPHLPLGLCGDGQPPQAAFAPGQDRNAGPDGRAGDPVGDFELRPAGFGPPCCSSSSGRERPRRPTRPPPSSSAPMSWCGC